MIPELDKQVEVYRRMTPAQKWDAAMRLYWSARGVKEAWLRKIHPEWDEDRVQVELKAFFSHGTRD
jgi:hypothetical protein